MLVGEGTGEGRIPLLRRNSERNLQKEARLSVCQVKEGLVLVMSHFSSDYE